MGYQPPQHQGYTDIKLSLEGFATSADTLTHAALCPYKGSAGSPLSSLTNEADDHVLLAAHTASRKVRLYSIKINWNQAAPTHPPIGPPNLSSQHLTTIDFCHPSIDSHWSWPAPELIRLDIIPRSYIDKTASVHPIVLATFIERDGDMNELPTRTILSRWQLQDDQAAIDRSFLQLSAKRGASNELKVTACRQLHRRH